MNISSVPFGRYFKLAHGVNKSSPKGGPNEKYLELKGALLIYDDDIPRAAPVKLVENRQNPDEVVGVLCPKVLDVWVEYTLDRIGNIYPPKPSKHAKPYRAPITADHPHRTNKPPHRPRTNKGEAKPLSI